MKISIATATFYYLPFTKSLDLISRAGFQNIELDMYWKGGDWEIAQHLKNVPPKKAINIIADYGLIISSLHDAGGVIEENHLSAINPILYEYIDILNDKDYYIVLHTPTAPPQIDENWWDRYESVFISELDKLKLNNQILIENLNLYKNYQDPLHSCEDLFAFTSENGLYVNMDTTHYGMDGTNIFHSLEILKNTKAIHLSDFGKDKSHIFIGEGELNLRDFVKELKKLDGCTITLECGMGLSADANDTDIINRLKQAKHFVEEALSD